MKIFSSFDTQLKNNYIHELSQTYGKENIVTITRSNFYFLKKVAIHIIFGLMSYLISVGGMIAMVGLEATISYGIWIPLPLSMIFFLIAAENYIDYSMNYAIFTPHEAILVEQIGLFRRNIRSLDVTHIKSITILKSNRIFSLFDDGLLSILNEGSHATNNMGEIVFKYVHKPEQKKEEIQRIIAINHQLSQAQ